jgi:hypothetical protein
LRNARRVDSLRDLLANKLSAIIERTEGKDFADLHFLLRQPGLDLETGMTDAQTKFGWPAIRYLLQTAFLRIDRLEAWPETTPPVSLTGHSSRIACVRSSSSATISH